MADLRHGYEIAAEQIGKALSKNHDNTVAVMPAAYTPSDKTKETMKVVRQRTCDGYTTSRRPRVEFNDLCLLDKDTACWLAYNGYQPNDGEAYPNDQAEAWKSNALRLVERNKVMSIAAHATARLISSRRSLFIPPTNTYQGILPPSARASLSGQDILAQSLWARSHGKCSTSYQRVDPMSPH